jgi:hypothetical protein
MQLLEDLGTQSLEDLDTQLFKDLGTQRLEHLLYQPQFLSKDRVGKSQNEN